MSRPLAAALALEDARPRQAMTIPTLEEVYREHFDFVYRTAAYLGGPGFDAEDAAQEVFLVVARRIDSFDGSAAFRTWLYGITFNVVRRSWRRRRLKRLFELRHDDPEPAAGMPIDTAEAGEARRLVHSILDKMRPKHREVLVLAELEGLSREEIAGLVGCKVETVWSRLHLARKEFARRLSKRGGWT